VSLVRKYKESGTRTPYAADQLKIILKEAREISGRAYSRFQQCFYDIVADSQYRPSKGRSLAAEVVRHKRR